VITGANCHRVTISATLNGGRASLPMALRLLAPGQTQVVQTPGTRAGTDAHPLSGQRRVR
jgi:hypothetical protein